VGVGMRLAALGPVLGSDRWADLRIERRQLPPRWSSAGIVASDPRSSNPRVRVSNDDSRSVPIASQLEEADKH